VYGHAQSIKGQFGINVPGQGVTDSLSRIDVQNDRQVHKAYQDVDVGDIGYPDLIYAGYFDISDQVRIDPEPVIAVRRSHPFLPGTTLQSLLSHDPGYFLVVDSPSFPLELQGDSPIPVSGKLQADIADSGFQNLLGRFLLLLMVKTSPGQIHEFAPPLNALDKGAILGNELSLFSVRLRLFLTALFKNSFSRVTLPSKHSSSRTLAASSASREGSAFNLPSAYCFFQIYNKPEEM
jgi:hypothetical protein